jgi:phosphoribosylformylglycinamidine cyclo-ligase
VLEAIRATGGVKAMAHITGGGFVDNIPRVLPASLTAHVDLSKIAAPAVFGWLSQAGGVKESEMLRTFNCGIGMVVVADAAKAGAVKASLEASGESVAEIGQLEPAGAERVRFSGSLRF